ncbi:hypothetical protein AY606_11440 [Acinetobacter sp. SFB]|uniref:hypothetical protein n=1 Tax=Acinetobacter sp. SFB TaxID=1805634 RepID=UPI0007D77816|nr:hypothetical protein [Acinetobacter sp. SFB]OAL77298.1 hypothetical protein AY606_11440 [Acinetobacter sp. SFB]
MARPHLTLEKWLSSYTDLKKEFLDLESSEKSGLIRKIVASGKKDHYLSKKDSSTRLSDDQDFTSLNSQNQSDLINKIFPYLPKFENDEFIVEINDAHFEILKKKFPSFKYNHNNKENNCIIKQITLDQKTLKELDRIREKYKFKSLKNCLEFLIDRQNSQLTEKNKIISTLKKEKSKNNDSILRKELKLKDEEIARIKTKLEQQKNTIHENMSKSAKEFEEYLVQIAVSKTIELEKIKAYVGDMSEVDQQSINGALAPEAINEIKDQFRKNCTEQKQLLIMKNQSNLNDALGFDQHSQYDNTVQNDDEVEVISNNERSNVKN